MKYSVIVCAREDGDRDALDLSLSDAVGLYSDRYEMIEEVGWASMADGYNNGLKQATGDICIFTHTDVRFLAGQAAFREAMAVLEDKSVGFIGVAGTTALSETAIWWSDPRTGKGAVYHTYGDTICVMGAGQTKVHRGTC